MTTATEKPLFTRLRRAFALTATVIAAVGVLSAAGAWVPGLGSARGDALCDAMRKQFGPGYPCISVPTNTFTPTAPAAPTPTTGPNGGQGQAGGPQVGIDTGPGPGIGNGTPIVPLPGQTAPTGPNQQNEQSPLSPGNQDTNKVAPPATVRSRSELGPGVTPTPTSAAAPRSSRDDLRIEASSKVEIPLDYVYDPDGKYNSTNDPGYKARHDYCTQSPDEFYAGTGFVDLRGPCAKHDMCYDVSDRVDKSWCDSQLRNDIIQTCDDRFWDVNPSQAVCMDVALGYWSAVVAAGQGGAKCQPVTPGVPFGVPLTNGNKYCQ